jgi:hypothetical protein
MATIIRTSPPTFGNATLDRGVECGITWFQTGDEELRVPTAELIINFIEENMLEPEVEAMKEEERLIDNAGFLIGRVIGQFIVAPPRKTPVY